MLYLPVKPFVHNIAMSGFVDIPSLNLVSFDITRVTIARTIVAKVETVAKIPNALHNFTASLIRMKIALF